MYQNFDSVAIILLTRQNRLVLSGTLGFSLFIAYILLALIEPNVSIALGEEDGFIENLGAVFWIFAFLTIFYAYIHSSRTSNRFFKYATKHNVWFFLLAIFFFACFGEEISWGQRILGWMTPDFWSDINKQKETNIHNLWLFSGDSYLNLGRFVTIICITYGFIIPILVKSSKQCHSLGIWLGLPIPSLAIGSLFLLNFLSFRLVLYVFHVDNDVAGSLKELHETNQAVVFFILALYLTFATRQESSSPKKR